MGQRLNFTAEEVLDAAQRARESCTEALKKAGPNPDVSTENPTQRARASEMAAGVIDNVSDQGSSVDDQAARKQRLLKGPKEFRDIGVDRKTKK